MLLAAALKETGLSKRYQHGTLTDGQRRTLLGVLVDRGREDLAESARLTFDVPATFADGEGFTAKVGRWASKAWSYLKGLRLAAVFALVGPGPLSPVEADSLRKAESQQRGYFDPFVDAAKSGEQLPTGIPDRIGKYASAAWQVAENVVRQKKIHSGEAAFEKRVLGDSLHCFTCAAEADRGWQPIGTLAPIGDSECQSRCKCHFVFSSVDLTHTNRPPAPSPPRLKFARDERSTNAGEKIVRVSVARLESEFLKDTNDYVASGGIGPSAKPHSYIDAMRTIEDARLSGAPQPMAMPRAFIDAAGNVSISDGRHRFAALRDSGVTTIPVAVPKGDVKRIREKVGAA